MSKERAKNRAEREHEAAIKAAAKGHEHDRRERQLSLKPSTDANGGKGEAITRPQHHKPPKAPAKAGGPKQATKSQAGTSGKGRPTPKQSGPRAAAPKKRAPVGRPDGPLARRRRFRVRLLLVLLLVVNVAAAVIWRDWAVSLAVLIGSFIVTPLLAALLLRRRK